MLRWPTVFWQVCQPVAGPALSRTDEASQGVEKRWRGQDDRVLDTAGYLLLSKDDWAEQLFRAERRGRDAALGMGMTDEAEDEGVQVETPEVLVDLVEEFQHRLDRAGC